MQCSKKSVVSLIRGNEQHVTTATAWEAPDILSIVEQESKEPEPTEEEVALQQAYEEALAKGHAEGLEKGYTEGFDKGYAEGSQKGESEARQKVEAEGQQQQEHFKQQAEETLSGVDALIQGLLNPLESQLDETVNRAIATLVTQVSSQVIKSELEVNPEHIVTVVKELFQQLPMTEREVRFYLHPEDKALLESGVQLSAGAFQWRMEEDEQITRGGCHVESHNFSVDERVEQRLEQSVRKVFGLSAEELTASKEEESPSAATEPTEDQELAAEESQPSEEDSMAADDSESVEIEAGAEMDSASATAEEIDASDTEQSVEASAEES